MAVTVTWSAVQRASPVATGVTATSPEPLDAALNIGDTLPFVVATDLSIDSVTAGPGGAMPTLSLSNGATSAD